jgi:hypothetical protein
MKKSSSSIKGLFFVYKYDREYLRANGFENIEGQEGIEACRTIGRNESAVKQERRGRYTKSTRDAW